MLLVDYKKDSTKNRPFSLRKSRFSVILALWGEFKALIFLKNCSIFLKPISKGNFWLLLIVDTEEKMFSMHPNL